MAVRGLPSHLDLNVADPPTSIHFYGVLLGALGYEREDVDGTRARWHRDLGGGAVWGIEIRAPREPAPRDRHERYSPGIDHLAFHAGSRDDVEQIAAAVAAAGYPIADPPAEYDYSPGYFAAAFDDPNGIRIEVVHEPVTNP